MLQQPTGHVDHHDKDLDTTFGFSFVCGFLGGTGMDCFGRAAACNIVLEKASLRRLDRMACLPSDVRRLLCRVLAHKTLYF